MSGLTVNPTTLTYDEMGRKLSMSDPDKGTWSYTYNMLGELITQKDATAMDARGNITGETHGNQGARGQVLRGQRGQVLRFAF